MGGKVDDLAAKYPKIFKPDFYFECGDGWYNLLDTLCKCIQDHLDRGRGDIPTAQVVADQVKEKFGELRFYVTGGDHTTEGMIDMAEEMSRHICEVCGDRGEVRSGSWIRTLCDEHVKG
jgi:hypothetical protein